MKKEPINLIVIDVSSWIGTSIMAQHFYGKLIEVRQSSINKDNVNEWSVYGESTELEHILTTKEARNLAKTDSQSFFDTIRKNMYRAGEISTRFEDVSDVIVSGIELYNKKGYKVPLTATGMMPC